MLKFFRSIRRKLIGGGHLRKYLIYALGEILLVMIGIILALQVNNWNEERKRGLEEIQILKKFQVSLEYDLLALNKTITFMNKSKSSMNLLLNHMENDLPWHDSLKYHFGNTIKWWESEIHTDVYETIKSKDWSIISNEQLSDELSNYYTWMTTTFSKSRNEYSDALVHLSQNVWNTRFSGFWETNYESWAKKNRFGKYESHDPNNIIGFAIPNDYEALKKDTEYLYSLRTLRNKYNWYREIHDQSARLILKELIENVKKEIEILEN